MKIAIQKVIGDMGEVWQIELQVPADVLKSKDPVAAIKAQASHVLRVADDRLMDINMRLIDHNRLAQTLDPAALLAMRQCVQVMYGQRGGAEQLPQEPPKKVTEGDVESKVESLSKALEGALEAVDEGGR